MISTLVIVMLSGAACGITAVCGVGVAFAWIYLPAVLLLSTSPPIPLPGVPDVTAPVGAICGIALGWMLRGGEPLRIRWHWVDLIVLLMAVSAVITAVMTEQFWTGVSTGAGLCLNWFVPYLMARVALRSSEARQAALTSVVLCLLVIGFFALIEARLWPCFLGRQLQSLGLYEGAIGATYRRYGLFRAQVTFCHPIDLGNACVLLMPILMVLANTTPAGTRSPWLWIGLGGALAGVVLSISFTSYVGLAATAAIFLVLRYGRLAARLLVPGVLLGMGGAVLVSVVLLDRPLRLDDDRAALRASLDVRALIMQRAWPVAKRAGLFGFGPRLGTQSLDLESVDNSYLLFAMQRGWGFVSLWLILALVLARQADRAMRQAVLPQQRGALAAAVAAVLGTMVAMYTVWFGFVYAMLLFVALGFAVTIIEDLTSRAVMVLPRRRFARPHRAVGAPQEAAPALARRPT